ncbi:hypothetical protein DNTS_016189 [Danionella cerebrum]|uniref:Uncharacterized protein n=1 Tax=Danionella cerebrum TaxID=2873325 RepID=A0A553R0X6_9TELE|nr:hypothetical protein DNTS_016189 [Danionella translucida]
MHQLCLYVSSCWQSSGQHPLERRSDGITIVQPGDCEIRRRLTPTEKILGSHAELCPSGECVWASAISVKDKLLYVSQPLRDRLLVIDTRTQRVLEAVKTDAMPVKVFYDKSHDQIFVLSWRHRLRRHSTLQVNHTGMHKLQVITSASSLEKHQIVHTPFQSVRGFYIPPTNLIITHVRFGFVFLKREAAVHKIDLETLQPVKTISLLDHSCVPTSMAYTHLSGYYLIECQPRNHSSSSWQLLIDGMSDSVIGRNPNINGKPFVSPNGRFVVSVDEKQGKLYTQRVSFLGELQLHHETDLYVAVADLEFHPSITDANQYTVVVTSTEDSQLVFMDLFSGETKFLESVKEPIDASSWHWGSGNRVVKSSGIFGRYLVTPALESVFILDGEQKGVRCEISGIRKGNTVVWVGEV